MEKRRRLETVNGETQLHESIIQHIQSFLNGKEVAQTSILSKSWYTAWSTHPNLDFDQRHFREGTDTFSEFSRKTMRRYETMGRKIESLRLWARGSLMMDKESHNRSLANELIVKAIKLGVSDLHIEVSLREARLVVPWEVFGSETLIRLSLINCKIDQGLDDGKVSCSRLKSLSLCKVLIEDDTIWDIIRSCPLIEKLILFKCVPVSVSKHGLNVHSLALSSGIEFRKRNVGSVVNSRFHLHQFHKLKYLFLEMVKIESLFFSDFSSTFPCLVLLFVHHCVWNEQIQICSRSLKYVSFKKKGELWAKFDVPRIRKFSFSGSCLPTLSFEKTSGEWESDISILESLDGKFGTLSLVTLKKLLKNLSQSKISLSIDIRLISEKNFEYVGGVEGLRRPVVENLMLLMMDAPCSICSALLGRLFWSCRPKFITQYLLPPESCVKENVGNGIVEIFFKRVKQVAGNQDWFVPDRSMFGQCDLEEVNAEYFEETFDEWRSLPWKALLDGSKDPENKQNIRFRLRWGNSEVMM